MPVGPANPDPSRMHKWRRIGTRQGLGQMWRSTLDQGMHVGVRRPVFILPGARIVVVPMRAVDQVVGWWRCTADSGLAKMPAAEEVSNREPLDSPACEPRRSWVLFGSLALELI